MFHHVTLAFDKRKISTTNWTNCPHYQFYLIEQDVIFAFGLDKVSSPSGAFGTYRNVRKGTQLINIGRDREWLKVDMGNGKIAYVLEDMTTR